MEILEHQRRSPLRRSLASPVAILVAGVAALLLLTRGSVLSSRGSWDEGATLLGTLLLAAGVVLVANYLSAGRKPQRGDRIEVRQDNDLKLDL